MQDISKYFNNLTTDEKQFFLKNTEFLNDSEIIDKFLNIERFNSQLLESISSNKSIVWTLEILKKYSNKLNWVEISSNTKTNWNLRILLTFKDKIEWNILSDNLSVNWTNLMIELSKDKIQWTKNFYCNSSINWTSENISNFMKYINFSENGLLEVVKGKNYNVEYFNNYLGNWDLDIISSDISFARDEKKILVYKDYIKWDIISPLIEWDERLIIQFINIKEVKQFISGNIFMSNEFIEANFNLFDLEYLCNNSNLRLGNNFIIKYANLDICYIKFEMKENFVFNKGLLRHSNSINWEKIITKEINNEIVKQIDLFCSNYKEYCLYYDKLKVSISKGETFCFQSNFKQVILKISNIYLRNRYLNLIKIERRFFNSCYFESNEIVKYNPSIFSAEGLKILLSKYNIPIRVTYLKIINTVLNKN